MIPALEAFEGSWTVDRRIEDRSSGRPGEFAGVATFSPGAGGLFYREKGTLILGTATPLLATRSYIWQAGQDGAIEVLFEDGRSFHRFGPGREANAAHWCDPDTYRVAYDFTLWPRWSATWTVSGPAKDYTMVSRYARPPRHG